MALSSRELTRQLVRPVHRCQGCDSSTLVPVIDFGHQAPVHALLRPQQLAEPEQTYPLLVVRCAECGLVQLAHVVDPRVIFPDDYPYLTSLTEILKTNFRELADQARERLGLGPRDLVVDVGSNDGTLLEGFQRSGSRVLGVEPTGVARIANERGIPTIQAFFDQGIAREIASEHGKARLVTGANVIAHVADIDGVLEGIAALLTEDGAFVSESHYLLGLIDRLQYDTIYHEHVRYYGLRPLARLFSRHGFHIVDAQHVPTHGGSIRIWAVMDRATSDSERLRAMIRAEDDYGLYSEGVYRRFGERVVDAKQRTLEILLRCRREGARVVGIGGPARASMLLNTCHVDPDLLQYVAEQPQSLKVGLYMPGTHIPVVDERRVLEEQPEYALLLSWHIADGIVPKLRAKGYRGKFIVPLPEPSILPA